MPATCICRASRSISEQLTREVVASLAVLAEERRQQISTHAGDGLSVMADRLVLREAITNVIDNAIKYSPIAASIAVSVHSDGSDAVIDVADQGRRHSAEHRERIFDRFFRVDTARSRDAGGTGLGLAIAKWAVEINGGSIRWTRGTTGGSVFRISLPRGNGMMKWNSAYGTGTCADGRGCPCRLRRKASGMSGSCSSASMARRKA